LLLAEFNKPQTLKVPPPRGSDLKHRPHGALTDRFPRVADLILSGIATVIACVCGDNARNAA
jgi:hypothetical protein